MSIDISDLAEYGPAVAAYRSAKNTATEAGDEAGIMRAEMNWTNTKMELMQAKVSANDQQRSLESARAKAAAEFPNAPAEIYAHLTDPDQLLAAAKSVHERLTAAVPAAQQEAQSQGSWGGTPPAAANSAGQDDPNILRTPEDVDRRVAELMPDVMVKGKLAMAANEEVASLRLAPLLSRYEPGAAAR